MRLTRRLSVLLMISVGINLFLAGMLVTQWLTATPMDMGGPFNRPAAEAALGAEHREVVQRIWSDNHAGMLDKLRQARRIRQQIKQQLDAESFDKAALERSFASLRDIMVPVGSDIFATIVEIAEALPVEERRRYFATGFAGGPPFPADPLDRPDPPAEAGPVRN